MPGTCFYCGHHNGDHDKNCPELHRGDVAFSRWERGYSLGRIGLKLHSKCIDPIMQMGWVRGDSAADEAANGCQSWGG